jgi:hypothetical protein
MRLVVIFALTLVFPAAALSASGGAPDPCKLVTTQNASAALGAPAKPYPQVSRSGARHCLYIASTGRIDVEIGSGSEYVEASAATSPKGTVIRTLPHLGVNGGSVYVPLNHLALAAFELGAYYYTVDSQQLRPSKVLALSELMLRKLGG